MSEKMLTIQCQRCHEETPVDIGPYVAPYSERMWAQLRRVECLEAQLAEAKELFEENAQQYQTQLAEAKHATYRMLFEQKEYFDTRLNEKDAELAEAYRAIDWERKRMVLAEAQARAAEAESHYHKASADMSTALQRVATLERALRRHGAHDSSCPRPWKVEEECTCGLQTALRQPAATANRTVEDPEGLQAVTPRPTTCTCGGQVQVADSKYGKQHRCRKCGASYGFVEGQSEDDLAEEQPAATAPGNAMVEQYKDDPEFQEEQQKLREAEPAACPSCDGTGKITHPVRMAYFGHQTETVRCSRCHGTGTVAKEEQV